MAEPASPRLAAAAVQAAPAPAGAGLLAGDGRDVRACSQSRSDERQKRAPGDREETR
jgi:hypothetical protein